MEGTPKQFSSPQEEIEYLRQRIAEQERSVLEKEPQARAEQLEQVSQKEMREYASFTPQSVLNKDYEMPTHEVSHSAESVNISHDPVEEIVTLAFDKGIKNALSVLEKSDNPYLIDEVHKQLIEKIRAGAVMGDLKEDVPPWHVLHMTLFEVTLPQFSSADEAARELPMLVGMMEQLLRGLESVGSAKENTHFVIELAVDNKTYDIIFYIAVPNEYVMLFEKQTLSIFPQAVLTIQPHDYNIFSQTGSVAAAEITLRRHPIYPLKSAESFATDPLQVILNAFSKLEQADEGAALQFVIRYPKSNHRATYENIIKDIERGHSPKEAIERSTFVGGVKEIVGELFSSSKSATDKKEDAGEKKTHSETIELFKKKIARDIVEVNIRVLVSTKSESRDEQILKELESAFHQFDELEGNDIQLKRVKGTSLRQIKKAFSFREFNRHTAIPLSLSELATMIHFPESGGAAAPQFKQSSAKSAAAPTSMPTEGTLLGVNSHRNVEREIYISKEDRLRHFYIIGQTGTGKTTLMKNMIIQDIEHGDGVCMIDPHGTDIDDVLGAVPPHREQDVIYFDPSNLDPSVGLNMLEYDPQKPEQKTFVVNELLSIFQKLYGANPESMGPMFEQYFRNATMLVMEDPDSGNTLMDISRVFSDARFRREKLAKATNPVVVQFWKEIATKAGGEASLENIVPYIVSKFDVFTANDYLRPIIGQQHSAFNFRHIMDEKKILLVNLAKGRIGEINANLIGMIFVGKILMAALSRVDDPSKRFAPFYLHMDEFQNVSTNSISAILSEARKYKLGLTIAHQFIAQLSPDIKDAVFGNVGSMATFRVGPEDAQFLEQQYSPVFTDSDLMNIPNREAYVRMLANGIPTSAFSMHTVAPKDTDPNRVAALKAASLARYGRSRVEIEAEIQARYKKPVPPVPPLGV